MQLVGYSAGRIVGGVTEGDDVGSQAAHDLIDRAAAEAAAQVAAVIGLFLEQAQRGVVGVIGPIHAAGLQIFAQRLDGPQEFPLLDGERADREPDGRAVAQQRQSIQHGERILAAR